MIKVVFLDSFVYLLVDHVEQWLHQVFGELDLQFCDLIDQITDVLRVNCVPAIWIAHLLNFVLIGF